jgi:hypothetical protein
MKEPTRRRFGYKGDKSIATVLVAFWFPAYAHGINLWGTYSIASFSVALLLVMLYERYLRTRKKTAALRV